MVEECKCIEYSWKWVTADELLSLRPCELCQVILTCANGNCNMKVYDGENETGTYVVRLKALINRSVNMGIHDHVYLRRGLFVTLDGNCLGAFVQWLEVPQGIGYPKE